MRACRVGRSGRAGVWLAWLIVIAVAAGCGSTPSGSLSSGSPGPTAGPSGPTVAPGSSAPSTAVTTAPVSMSPAATPSGAGTSPATSPAPASSMVVFLLRGEHLVPVERALATGRDVVTAAVESLLAGPTDEEARPADGSPGLTSAIPAGTTLRGITVSGATAVVDLSAQFAAGGGSASMFARLAQVVFTVTQVPVVTGVTFRLDGRPVTTFSSEGIVLAGPSVRADFRDQLPAIFLERPAWGARVPNPARLQGLADVFEAQFLVEIATANRAVIARRAVTASCGTGCWGEFDMTLAYPLDQAQPGWVTVYDLSAKDGSREHVSSYPVTLTASP